MYTYIIVSWKGFVTYPYNSKDIITTNNYFSSYTLAREKRAKVQKGLANWQGGNALSVVPVTIKTRMRPPKFQNSKIK